MQTRQDMGEDDGIIVRKPEQTNSSSNYVTLPEDSIASEDDIIILRSPPEPSPSVVLIDDNDENMAEYNVKIQCSPETEFNENIPSLPETEFYGDIPSLPETEYNEIASLPETEYNENATLQEIEFNDKSVIKIENNEDTPLMECNENVPKDKWTLNRRRESEDTINENTKSVHKREAENKIHAGDHISENSVNLSSSKENNFLQVATNMPQNVSQQTSVIPQVEELRQPQPSIICTANKTSFQQVLSPVISCQSPANANICALSTENNASPVSSYQLGNLQNSNILNIVEDPKEINNERPSAISSLSNQRKKIRIPGQLVSEVKNIIIQTVLDVLNRRQQLELSSTLQGKPGKPLDLHVTCCRLHSIDLKWTHPISDGGSQVMSFPSHYIVEFKTRLGSWKQSKKIPASQNTACLTDLRPRLCYQFRVIAVNKAGRSDPSNVTPIVAKNVKPCKPGNLQITVCGPGHIDLEWTHPISDGGSQIMSCPSHYTVELKPVYGRKWKRLMDVPANQSTASVRDLKCGQYRFRVVAVNKSRGGETSDATRLIFIKPGQPPSQPETPEIEICAAEAVLKLKWRPPKRDGGSEITSYKIFKKHPLSRRWVRALKVPGAQLTADIPDLVENKFCAFRIQANNKYGGSRLSNCTGPHVAKSNKLKRIFTTLEDKSCSVDDKIVSLATKKSEAEDFIKKYQKKLEEWKMKLERLGHSNTELLKEKLKIDVLKRMVKDYYKKICDSQNSAETGSCSSSIKSKTPSRPCSCAELSDSDDLECRSYESSSTSSSSSESSRSPSPSSSNGQSTARAAGDGFAEAMDCE